MFAKLRSLLRFDLATLICFVMALNLMVFVNWQTRDAHFHEIALERHNHFLYRPVYEVGWPVRFLKLNGIDKRIVTNSELDRAPRFELMYPACAAICFATALAIAIALTLTFAWIRRECAKTVPEKRRSKPLTPTP